MKKFLYNALFLFFLVAGSTGTGSVKASEQPDAENTEVFDMSNVNISFNIKVFGLATIHGSFDRLNGVMVNNRDGDPGIVTMHIDANSINTNDDERDDYLRGPTFFEVALYPVITFKGNCQVRSQQDTMHLVGLLELHGKSREVVFEILPGDKYDQASDYIARTSIKRSEFGLNSLRHIVSDEIEIIVTM